MQKSDLEDLLLQSSAYFIYIQAQQLIAYMYTSCCCEDELHYVTNEVKSERKEDEEKN